MRILPFDVHKAIPAAWDFLWAANLEQRRKDEADAARTGREVYRAAATYYITASDLENQVRRFARETAEGQPWGSTGRAYGREGSWTNVGKLRLTGGLNGAVRDFLLRNPKIEGHNFGRGHISGMRFRPRGEPLAPTEQKTIKTKAEQADRPRPVHLWTKGYGSRLLCVKPKPYSYSRHRGLGPRGTRDPSEVTCPRCLKLLPTFTCEATDAH